MLKHQKSVISIIYSNLEDLQNFELVHLFQSWKHNTTAKRGELDRKKTLDLKYISDAIGCDRDKADLFQYIYAVDLYLTYRSIKLLKIAFYIDLNQMSRMQDYFSLGWKKFQIVESILSHYQELKILETLDVRSTFTKVVGSSITDIFQEEFQKLMPRQVRHALGQFYTPFWLAKHTLHNSGYTNKNIDSLLKVVCDPACGSGVFLVVAAEEIRQSVINNDLSKDFAKQLIIENLRGYDIEDLPALLAYINLALAYYIVSGSKIILDELPKLSIFCSDSLDEFHLTEEVDLLVGNPPWTNWEYTPTEFKIKHANMWEYLGIFNRSDNRSSFSKEDVSALFVSHSIYYRLKNGGTFAFIVPESLIKSSKNHRGFRKFTLGPDKMPYSITLAEDFVDIKPFESINNRTVVIYGIKGEDNSYPIPFHKWSKLDSDNLTAAETAIPHGRQEIYEANLSILDDIGSGWSTSVIGSANIHRFLDGKNAYRARTGLFTGGANAVFHLKILDINSQGVKIENITERAKRQVPITQARIEPDYIYPFLRGRDVHQWHYDSTAYTLLPHTRFTRMHPVPESDLNRSQPETLKYLKNFVDILKDRRGFSKWEEAFLEEGFYCCQRIGDYTFAEWKVVWRYISKSFMTAVIGPKEDKFLGLKSIIPNEKLMLIACKSAAEAYFVGGVLASTPVISHIQSRMISTQISPSIIENIRIPLFDPNNITHIKISDLCRQGHEIRRADATISIEHLINQIDIAVAKLWNFQ